MSAKKKNSNRYANYLFSLKGNNIEETSKYYLGNLKSNFSSSKYNLNGVEKNYATRTSSKNKMAFELAFIKYVD